MQLSKHFSLSEFERSATATKHGIDNRVPWQYIPALQQLCKEILEPLREFINSSTPPHKGEKERVLLINSGYRCPLLNVKIGGVYASQHTLGEAADIRLPVAKHTEQSDGEAHTDMAVAYRWLDFLEHHTDFDQLILEHSHGEYWLHVCCRQNKRKNRHQVIRNMQKK